MESLRKSLHEQWVPSRYTIPVNQGQLVQARLTDGALMTPRQPATNSTPSQTSEDSRRFLKISSQDSFVDLASSGVTPAKKSNVKADVTRRNSAHVTDCPVDLDDESSGKISTRLSGDEIDGQDGVGDKHTETLEAYTAGSMVEVIPGNFSSQSTSLDGGEEVSDQATSHKRCCPEGGQVGERMTPDDTMGEIEDVYSSHDIPQGRGKRTKAKAGDPEEAGASATRDEGQSASAEGKVGEGSRCAKVAVESSGVRNSPTNTVADDSRSRIRSSGAPCTPLAFELSSVLEGCREASRLKRQRDLKNASARSFSGNLSGTASAEDPDCKAAARAFSRVLRKVFTCMIVYVRERVPVIALKSTFVPSTLQLFVDSRQVLFWWVGCLLLFCPAAGALHADACCWTIQLGVHHLSLGRRPVYIRSACLR